jgi:hypothetical protein
MLRDVNSRGDQREIIIQLVANNRRKKRKGKGIRESVHPVEFRAMHVLENGKIVDYTHPKEVDPYWGSLYKQYEYLVYIETYYRMCLKQGSSRETTHEDDVFNLQIFQQIEQHKKTLTRYMMNFMSMMYGSIMNTRFYGWMRYADDFTSMFNEAALSAIRGLRFDINKTRCSVYFYQAFWLCGLSMIAQISERLKSEYQNDVDLDRGSKTFSTANCDNETVEEMFFENSSGVIDSYETIGAYFEKSSEETESNAVDSPSDVSIFDLGCASAGGIVDNSLVDPSCTAEAELIQNCEASICESLTEFLARLLAKFGIGIDYIYKATDQSLVKLGGFIKKKIKKGEVILTEEELDLINKILSRA